MDKICMRGICVEANIFQSTMLLHICNRIEFNRTIIQNIIYYCVNESINLLDMSEKIVWNL
jgi:hypothetical protein